MKIQYVAKDGMSFDTEKGCREYERTLKSELDQKVEDFLTRLYGGRELMAKYNRREQGTWRILGEDPNCELQGRHHQPDLGTYTGTLEQVVRYAVSLSNFYTWGGGGNIIKVSQPGPVPIVK